MKIALVTPNYHQSRGNTITVERISRGLNRLGVITEIISITEEQNFPKLPPVDLVHGFNAHHFYKFWTNRGSLAKPYLITLTGTDLNHSLVDGRFRSSIVQILKDSDAVHIFNHEAKKLLWQEVPEIKEKTYLIPQGINLFSEKQNRVLRDKDSFVFILPAGIRKVKNIPAAISFLEAIYKQNPRVRLWIMGPIIEEQEGKIVRELIKKNTHWIRYWGEVPHSQMGDIYRHADVLLNTSLSEGQSSAILEAMALGVPVLGSDIAGNRDIVQQGKTGFLFTGEQDFEYYAKILMASKSLRREMGSLGKEYVQKHHSLEKEVNELQSLYRKILNYKAKVIS